jgi:hypothetical protein
MKNVNIDNEDSIHYMQLQESLTFRFGRERHVMNFRFYYYCHHIYYIAHSILYCASFWPYDACWAGQRYSMHRWNHVVRRHYSPSPAHGIRRRLPRRSLSIPRASPPPALPPLDILLRRAHRLKGRGILRCVAVSVMIISNCGGPHGQDRNSQLAGQKLQGRDRGEDK